MSMKEEIVTAYQESKADVITYLERLKYALESESTSIKFELIEFPHI